MIPFLNLRRLHWLITYFTTQTRILLKFYRQFDQQHRESFRTAQKWTMTCFDIPCNPIQSRLIPKCILSS